MPELQQKFRVDLRKKVNDTVEQSAFKPDMKGKSWRRNERMLRVVTAILQ